VKFRIYSLIKLKLKICFNLRKCARLISCIKCLMHHDCWLKIFVLTKSNLFIMKNHFQKAQLFISKKTHTRTIILQPEGNS
jgi:hypothetical protein